MKNLHHLITKLAIKSTYVVNMLINHLVLNTTAKPWGKYVC